ncbi:MAG: hypothetical protein EOO95_13565, partial [Pedobacter sp.]
MKNKLEVNFLENYNKRYDFIFKNHPEEDAFSITKKDGSTVKFSDDDLDIFDARQNELMLDDEMNLDIMDIQRANMYDFHIKLNACTIGSILDTSYEHHMMGIV